MSSGVGIGKGVDPGPGFGKGVYGMAQASDAARVWMALKRVPAQACMALASEYALALELAPHGIRGQQGMNTHDAGV